MTSYPPPECAKCTYIQNRLSRWPFAGNIGPPLSFAHEHKWQTVLSGGSQNTFPFKANANRWWFSTLAVRDTQGTAIEKIPSYQECYNSLGDLMDMLVLGNNTSNFLVYCLMSTKFRRTLLKVGSPSWICLRTGANKKLFFLRNFE